MRFSSTLLTFGLILSAGNLAQAQNTTLFGSQSQTGGAANGGGNAGANGGVGGGQAGVTQQLGQASGLTIGDIGQASQQVGQQGFIGSNNSGGFTGTNQAGQQAAPNSPQFNQGRGGGGGNFNGGTVGQQTRKIVRPRARIAFKYSKPQIQQIRTRVTTQIGRVFTRKAELQNLTMRMSDAGVAVVSGTVESEDDARLALALLRLEPGVKSVENKMTVAESKSGS